MGFEHIIYSEEAGVATITLNRPQRLNALIPPLTRELGSALEAANSNDEVKALVITGAGRAFCAGADIAGLSDPDAVFRRLVTRSPSGGGIWSFSLQLQNFEKPTIAAVNGPAVGAGLSLALACDIRIASENASFAQVFTKRGLVPDHGSSYFLPRLVGMAKACEMVFTGDTLDAKQAKEYGLVSRVTPPEGLMPEVQSLAQRIARAAPVAIKLAKKALYRGAASDLGSALEFEGYMQGMCFKTEDFREALAAFAEKRDAHFTGK